MIIKTEEKNGIKIYTVKKDFDDATMEKRMNQFIKPDQIKTILDHDADVYTEDGRLLLRFRKNVLPKENIEEFYENIKDFAEHTTSNRGNATGSKKRNLISNPRVMSNIFGYFDSMTPKQKIIFRKSNFKPAVSVRECRFNQDHPEKYKKTIPLIQDIDKLYAKLTPEQYKLQRKKANQTHFKIPDTAFTTVTTNMNYQTATHTDKGDDDEGFGNLAVIEKGEYTGAETCFPQYGIGVDVRTGDILFMDVHQPHSNLPMHKKTEDAVRLSIVCYLRKKVWERTRGKTRRFRDNHNKKMQTMRTYKG